MFSYHGGTLWLDFVNTQFLEAGEVRDGLADLKDLHTWIQGAGVGELVLDEDAFSKLKVLRAQLRHIAEEGGLSDGHLAWLNDQLAALPGTWTYRDGLAEFLPYGCYLEKMSWLLLRSLLDFLTVGQVARLKKCGNHLCIQYYYDTSKNNTRRWCRMEVCGNREKARRHHHRHKSSASQEDSTP
ncbi:CGNR zinc finger domain-containing protein [Tumebacillus sp. ITR2]|uniref:CGNR zinc finger domain-containing protein n=1 Tax=Tumebacillus amylolyticus TaxID=2801339 RepID=A0ABS1J8X0_9BACL|nr:CGNR zinc finger domain-containing protein [Tumebacillus amylolyticus]MBL0386727.1 CGNR zinc finger domain-containing protein [Tumebacillus amylolyticus]